MAKRKKRIKHAEIVQGFAARLRALRQAKELSQADLARDADVALSHLSKLERGEAAPGLDLVGRLADALGDNVSALIPTLTASTDAEARRDRVRKLFDGLVTGAGLDTLAVLEGLISRLAESTSSKL